MIDATKHPPRWTIYRGFVLNLSFVDNDIRDEISHDLYESIAAVMRQPPYDGHGLGHFVGDGLDDCNSADAR